MQTRTIIFTRDLNDLQSTPVKPAGRPEPAPSKCPMHRLFAPADHAGGMLSRIALFTFGLVAYAMFFGTILYAIGFVSGLFVPKTINSGTVGAIVASLLINTGLLMLFVVQHTIMARPAFKRIWTKIVPHAIERSIFVAAASACLMLLFWQWRPLPDVVWDVSSVSALKYGLTALGLFGWAIVFISSFMVSHFDLFGLRQVWMKLRGQPYHPIAFRLVGFYKIVRHPLMVGFLTAFWSTPTMTLGHLFFAAMTTAYILFGTWIEERDLMAQFGQTYADYRRRVRGLIPIPRG